MVRINARFVGVISQMLYAVTFDVTFDGSVRSTWWFTEEFPLDIVKDNIIRAG